MRSPELDYLLTTMLDSQPEVSDLLFTAGKSLQVESFGELKPVTCEPPIERLTPFQTEMVALNIMGDNLWHIGDLLRRGSCDTAYTLTDKARFRISIFSQRGNYSIVLRKLNTVIPTLDSLNFPEIIKQIPREKTGLVLVTGATGSGKSTTLAAVLNEISHTRPVHIITLEDPIEFVHSHDVATFNQRELGTDFDTFSNGLRAALRQAPKVILVGEMRDRETIKIALSAAETGHLVLSTLHTVDAGQTINRILGMFETEEQEQLRARLADVLRWVISQRYALLEIMGSNLRTEESIRLAETEGKSFYEITEASQPFGWRTFDFSALEAYEQGKITEETALLYCSKRGPVTRGIDNIKKTRGESTHDGHSLRMKAIQDADVFVSVGLELDGGWLPLVIPGSRNPKIQPGAKGFVDASEGVNVLEKPTGTVSRAEGDIHPLGNPHYYTDPANLEVVADHLARIFSELDPTNADDYQANAKAFDERMEKSLVGWKKELKPYKGASMVVYHENFVYFATCFDMKLFGTVEPKPGIPPNPRYLAETAEAMKTAGVKVVLYQPYYDAEAARQLAKKADGVAIEIPTEVGGMPEAKDVFSKFDFIVSTLVKAFSQGR